MNEKIYTLSLSSLEWSNVLVSLKVRGTSDAVDLHDKIWRILLKEDKTEKEVV